MAKQHVAVPLLEGVHSSVEALALRRPTTIGGIDCDVLLPVLDPAQTPGDMRLKPPNDEYQERDLLWAPATGWPGVTGWPAEAEWGRIHDFDSVIISTVGLIPVSEPVPWNGRLLDFDHSVGQWRHLLRDWLAVIAEGPTDFLDLPVKGETNWNDEGYTNEVWTYYFDNLHQPQRVSRWQWEHVIAHTYAGDQPPLARALLTTAKRAAATGNPRLAVIDAATAAEVALTTGLTDRLSADTSSQVAQILIERTRMLGPRLELAGDLGMRLPDRIRLDLVDRRNAVVHRGTGVTDTDAQAAITAAAKLVDDYEPLATHCREPSDTSQ